MKTACLNVMTMVAGLAVGYGFGGNDFFILMFLVLPIVAGLLGAGVEDEGK